MEDSESGEDSNNDQDFITPRPEGQINHAPTPDSKQQMSELSEFHNLCIQNSNHSIVCESDSIEIDVVSTTPDTTLLPVLGHI